MPANHAQAIRITRDMLLQFVLIFTPLMAIALTISIFIYYNATRTDRQVTRLYEQEIINLQRQGIINIFTGLVSDLRVLAAHRALHVEQPGDLRKAIDCEALAGEFRSFALHKKIYDQVRLLDKTGMEIVRANYNHGDPVLVPREELQHKGQRYYFRDTFNLSRDEVFVSPFDLNIEKGVLEKPLKPMIRMGIPVFDSARRKCGVVILNYLGQHLLEQIERLSTGSPGQIMLLNTEGYWLKGPHTEDEWGFMFADHQDRTFQQRFPEAWKTISGKPEGQFLNRQGLFTFTSVHPFPAGITSSDGSPEAYKASTRRFRSKDYQWIIVSHVSPRVYYAGASRLRTRIIYIDALVLLITGLGCAYITATRVRKRQADQARLELIDELQAALKNVETLSGMLPICANCKKVRDDTGYWNQLETYIESHSEAQFSHGVCPECARNLYGDEPWYDEDDLDKT